MNIAEPARRSGPSTGVSVTVLILGFVAGAIGSYMVIAPILRTYTSPSFSTPGTARMHLSRGTYLVYESTGSNRFGISSDTTTTVTADDVTVIAYGGGRIAVRNRYGSIEELNRSGSTYVGAVEFEIDNAGQYLVSVRTPTAGRMIVARPLTDTIFSNAEWLIAVLIGAGMFVTGTVMWIVGASRRRRQRMAYGYYGSAAAGYGNAPAGWYADPQQAGRLRYWDGTTWTEHVN